MNCLLNIINNATKQFMSVKSVKTKQDFFDEELEKMRIVKNRLYKIAQYTTVDSDEKWHDYRIYKNEYKNTIQTKKYESNQKKLDNAKGDMKATWKVLNTILCKENSEISTIKRADDVVIEDDQIIANEFNQFFINSIIELNESIPICQYEEEVLPEQHKQLLNNGLTVL